MIPKCFDSEHQYIEWISADKIVQASRLYRPSLQCIDCTPSYALQMREEGRCERPDVKFKRTNGDEWSGYDPRITDDSEDIVGVHFHKQRQMWVAKIWGKGRYRTIGYFATKAEAKEARISAMMGRMVVEA